MLMDANSVVAMKEKYKVTCWKVGRVLNDDDVNYLCLLKQTSHIRLDVIFLMKYILSSELVLEANGAVSLGFDICTFLNKGNSW